LADASVNGCAGGILSLDITHECNSFANKVDPDLEVLSRDGTIVLITSITHSDPNGQVKKVESD